MGAHRHPPAPAEEFQGLLDWIDDLGIRDEIPEVFFLEMAVERKEISLADIGHDPEVTAICEVARGAFHTIASKVSGEEFFLGAQRRGLQCGVVNTISDVLADEHFRRRGFFVPQRIPGRLEPVTFPGPPFRMSGTPCGVRRPAPGPGQDNTQPLPLNDGTGNQ